MKLLAVWRLRVHVYPRPSGKLAAGQLCMALFYNPEGILHRQDLFNFVVVDEKHERKSSLGKLEEPHRVFEPDLLFILLRDPGVGIQELDVLELHPAARVVVRIIGGEEKMSGAKKIHRVSQLRLLRLDGPVEVVPEIIAGR
jgi:hypothetical protein